MASLRLCTQFLHFRCQAHNGIFSAKCMLLAQKLLQDPMLKSSVSSSSKFRCSNKSAEEIRENFYNPYRIAEKPEDAKELEPPITYFVDTRFDEPDYDMPKEEALEMYAQSHPADMFTEFEESQDPLEWSYVERLIPLSTVAAPPPHGIYPTPSGWVPPNPDPSLTWKVRRNKLHHYSIFVNDLWRTKAHVPGGFKVTVVKRIEGNVWDFEKAAKHYLASLRPPPQRHWQKKRHQEVETQVNELGGSVRFKGIYFEELGQFLINHGM